ncbi:MAG TPA: DUF3558 domain-containing protein [Candidatus Dietzia intestinigallinarum]|nr:DUF3558 domain-containing protein [Candidatus Dietzia intestinigallinarum]
MSRGVGAVLVAAAVVVSGCGADDGEVTTTSPPPAAPVNPWDLPAEERPDLFDPCAEIPVEAVEEGAGSRLEVVDEFSNYRPGELISCGWKNDEVHISMLSTWKSKQEFLTDSSLFTLDPESNSTGRPSVRMRERADSTDIGCFHLFFTELGTVMFRLDLISSLDEFRGERFVESCDALDEAAGHIVAYIPNGDF